MSRVVPGPGSVPFCPGPVQGYHTMFQVVPGPGDVPGPIQKCLGLSQIPGDVDAEVNNLFLYKLNIKIT